LWGYQPVLFSELSAKCERDQAGAKQQQPDNRQDKETERRKIFTHWRTRCPRIRLGLIWTLLASAKQLSQNCW